MTGSITTFALSYSPKGWLPCKGQLLNIAEYPNLHKCIGDVHGGDGTNNFALPQLSDLTANTNTDNKSTGNVSYIQSAAGEISLFAGKFIPQGYVSTNIPNIKNADSGKHPDMHHTTLSYYIKL